MSTRARGIFGRFLEETGLRAKRPSPEPAADEDSAELFLLARRLRRLRTVRAPARLRARVLARLGDGPAAAEQPEPMTLVDVDEADLELVQRLRRLRSVRAPARLRARTLAPTREWQSAQRVIPLARARRARQGWGMIASRAVAAIGIVIFAGYGTYAVSASPLPGSPFYPIKLVVEDLRVAVASPDDKPRMYIEQADQRLEETRRLIESGQYPEAEKTVKDAERSIDAARVSASQTMHPQRLLPAIEDAHVRAQAVAERVAQHAPVAPAISSRAPGQPRAALPAPAAAPEAAVAPRPSEPPALPVESIPAGPVVAAPVPRDVETIGAGSTAQAPTPPPPTASPAAAAPAVEYAPIQTSTVGPTRTATAGAATSPTPAPTSTRGVTPTRTSAPATPPPTVAPATQQPQASPGVAAPGNGFTLIPPQ